MQFKANRALYGDYGSDGSATKVDAGQVFEVPHYRVEDMRELEASGVVERHIPRARVDRKAYTAYPNKAIQPPLNKSAAK